MRESRASGVDLFALEMSELYPREAEEAAFSGEVINKDFKLIKFSCQAQQDIDATVKAEEVNAGLVGEHGWKRISCTLTDDAGNSYKDYNDGFDWSRVRFPVFIEHMYRKDVDKARTSHRLLKKASGAHDELAQFLQYRRSAMGEVDEEKDGGSKSSPSVRRMPVDSRSFRNDPNSFRSSVDPCKSITLEVPTAAPAHWGMPAINAPPAPNHWGMEIDQLGRMERQEPKEEKRPTRLVFLSLGSLAKNREPLPKPPKRCSIRVLVVTVITLMFAIVALIGFILLKKPAAPSTIVQPIEFIEVVRNTTTQSSITSLTLSTATATQTKTTLTTGTQTLTALTHTVTTGTASTTTTTTTTISATTSTTRSRSTSTATSSVTTVTSTATMTQTAHCVDDLPLVGASTDEVLPDDRITASNDNPTQPDYSDPSRVRIDNKDEPWCAMGNPKNQWLAVDFGELKVLTGIRTGGNHASGFWANEYVSKFTMEYTTGANGAWKTFPVQFDGNYDRRSLVDNDVEPAMWVQKVRIRPVEWNRKACMRVELLGCQWPHSSSTTTSFSSTTSSTMTATTTSVSRTTTSTTTATASTVTMTSITSHTPTMTQSTTSETLTTTLSMKTLEVHMPIQV